MSEPHLARGELLSLLLSTSLCYCVLYGPQVVINPWIQLHHLSPQRASALVYVTLIPMSIAPLSYGALLGSVDTRRIIIYALSCLALITGIFAYVESYPLMLACRIGQGIFLPAVMTSTMSRLSAMGGHQSTRLMSYYLCATVLGGLLGRLITGYLASWCSLSMIWLFWASLIALVMLFLRHLSRHLSLSQIPFNAQPIRWGSIKRALTLSGVPSLLFSSAVMFGVFASALNLLPLRAAELGLNRGSRAIADRYWGYLFGAGVALIIPRIDRWMGGRGLASVWGLFIMSFALYWGTLPIHYAPLFVMVFLLCGGLFMVHPLFASRMTQYVPNERGLMSGLYVSSYYMGGAIFSGLSSEFMPLLGWSYMLFILGGSALFAAGLTWWTISRDFESDLLSP